MKPGKIDWASNDNYAAGPETGNPTKIPAPSGRSADGWEPGEPPPAAWWNYITWAVNERLNFTVQLRLKNFQEKSVTPATPVFGAAATVELAGCYRPLSTAGLGQYKYHHIEVYDSNAAAGYSVYSSGGERFTGAATGLALTASPYSGAMVSDLAGNVAIGVGGAASGLYYSVPATPLTMAAWAGTAGDEFVAMDYDPGNGYWIGIDRINTRIESGNVLGAALTVRLTNASLTSGSNLKRSKHGVGKLYPDDPGNDVGLAFGNTGSAWYRSTDAASATWGTLAPAPFVPQVVARNCLGYSFLGSRWGTIISNGPVTGAGNLTFAYSDDNGDNWVEVNDAFEWSARGFGAWSPPATDEAHLVCDGFGHWMAAFNANDGFGDQVMIFVSSDNGLTWERVAWPMSPSTASGNPARIAAWYGDGAFWLAHAGYVGASIMEVCGSIRLGE